MRLAGRRKFCKLDILRDESTRLFNTRATKAAYCTQTDEAGTQNPSGCCSGCSAIILRKVVSIGKTFSWGHSE